MGQPPQATVEEHPPQGLATFALDALVPGLVVRSRVVPTETPAQCAMMLPAWGRDDHYLTPLKCHGAHTHLKPSPPPTQALSGGSKGQHHVSTPISTMWPGHHLPVEGGSNIGASRQGDARWGRAPGDWEWVLKIHPVRVGRWCDPKLQVFWHTFHCPFTLHLHKLKDKCKFKATTITNFKTVIVDH